MSKILGDGNCSFQVMQRAPKSKRTDYTVIKRNYYLISKNHIHTINNDSKPVKLIKILFPRNKLSNICFHDIPLSATKK